MNHSTDIQERWPEVFGAYRKTHYISFILSTDTYVFRDIITGSFMIKTESEMDELEQEITSERNKLRKYVVR